MRPESCGFTPELAGDGEGTTRPESVPTPVVRVGGALTRSVWSWLPVTSRPAAAFRAVMGFWCAQDTVWVS